MTLDVLIQYKGDHVVNTTVVINIAVEQRTGARCTAHWRVCVKLRIADLLYQLWRDIYRAKHVTCI